jgi:hypothetical protein
MSFLSFVVEMRKKKENKQPGGAVIIWYKTGNIYPKRDEKEIDNNCVRGANGYVLRIGMDYISKQKSDTLPNHHSLNTSVKKTISSHSSPRSHLYSSSTTLYT